MPAQTKLAAQLLYSFTCTNLPSFIEGDLSNKEHFVPQLE